MQEYIRDHFVPVWIEDQKDDLMAQRLGLSQEGYPNVAVYAKGEEYVGRVVGFGGLESWFDDLKAAVAVGDSLTAAKAAAEKDPAKWMDAAQLVSGIPGRAKDALALLEKVPDKVKKSKDFKAMASQLEARMSWAAVDAKLQELMQGIRSLEQAKEKAPEALSAVEAHLEKFGGADADSEPAALAKQGFFLVILDRTDEAAAVAKTLLDKFPKSDQVKALLRGLR